MDHRETPGRKSIQEHERKIKEHVPTISKSCVDHLQAPFGHCIDPVDHHWMNTLYNGLPLLLVYHLQNMPRGGDRLADASLFEDAQELSSKLLVRRAPAPDASHEEWENHELPFNAPIGGDLAGKLKYLPDAL